MAKARIYIRSHVLRSNKDAVVPEPPIIMEGEKGISYAHNVSIDGPSMVVYKPDQRGPSVWIECDESDIWPWTAMDKSIASDDEDCGCD